MDIEQYLKRSVVVFSLDVDWVSDDILEWTLHLFADEGWPVTVFATHETKLLKQSFNRANIDVGIHPDFFNQTDHAQVIEQLMRLYPTANGVRSHGLFEYANLMPLYRQFGLQWDSSQLLYLCPHIRPYRHPSGLVRLPIIWEDDDYFSNEPDWNIAAIGIDQPGVKCFDFHPIHLYLNSYTASQYSFVKENQFAKQAIEEAKYKGKDKGILSFFCKLTDFIKTHDITVSTINQVCSWV